MRKKIQIRFVLGLLAAALCLGTGLHSAAQTQPAGDITGKWHFVFDTEGGDREFDANFQVDGGKVTGKWADTADVKGTYADGKLSLEFPTDSEVGQGTLKIDGSLADDQLTGTWVFQQYTGNFKATRVKPAAE